MRSAGVVLVRYHTFRLAFLPSTLSIFSPMEITGAGLMTAPVAGAATVPQTTVPSIQHGGLERAVSASLQDAADTLCSLTPWCRYVARGLCVSAVLLNARICRDAPNTVFLQVNEETGNRRPVMLTVQKMSRLPKPVKAGSITDSEREEADRSKPEEAQTDLDPGASLEMSAPKDDSNLQKESTSGPSSSLEADGAQSADIVVPGLSEDMTTILIRACVSMISVPVDPDTLHATLRLCLRLTRNHHYAMMFAELKSTRMILGLTQTSGFNGFAPLVTLLFRHIIEDPATLRHTMEKVSRS